MNLLILVFVTIADTKRREFSRWGPNSTLDMIGETAATALLAGEAILFRVPISSESCVVTVLGRLTQRLRLALAYPLE